MLLLVGTGGFAVGWLRPLPWSREWTFPDPHQVPWEDLRYLFGEIMYGGHITDDWDRKLCCVYLEEFMNPSLVRHFLKNHFLEKKIEFFSPFYFILDNSWITMLCSFPVYSQVIQLYMYMCLFFRKFFFLVRLFHNNGQSSLCYTVGLCWLSILNLAMCTYPSQTPYPFSPSVPLATISSFSKAVSFRCHV